MQEISETMLIENFISTIDPQKRWTLNELILHAVSGCVFVQGAHVQRPLSDAERISIVEGVRSFLTDLRLSTIHFDVARIMFGESTSADEFVELLSDEFLASSECRDTGDRIKDLCVWAVALVIHVRRCSFTSTYLPPVLIVNFVISVDASGISVREVISALHDLLVRIS